MLQEAACAKKYLKDSWKDKGNPRWMVDDINSNSHKMQQDKV